MYLRVKTAMSPVRPSEPTSDLKAASQIQTGAAPYVSFAAPFREFFRCSRRPRISALRLSETAETWKEHTIKLSLNRG